VRVLIARAAAVAAALILAVPLALAAGDAPVETVPMRMTAGDDLKPAEEEAVRRTLTAYLEALQKRDWRGASKYVDRESFLEGIEPLVAAVEPDEHERPPYRRMIFGASTFDSLKTMPLDGMFAAMMQYALTADPHGVLLMERARFSLLGARKIKGRVHIAYQLTLPAENDSTPPYTRVTAERLRQVGKDWKILIQHDK
jgi:hypothetical protein